MKNLKLIRLVNEKPYLENNLKKDLHGIVVEESANAVLVLFFNPGNVGDYAIVKVSVQDVVFEKEEIPFKVKAELLCKLDEIIKNAQNYLKPSVVNDYDMVELMVEKEGYSKHGIHKGDIGCVMDSNAVQGYVEVDFNGIDENNNHYGDCISVKISDLKVIK